jgi:hypothetical protein
MKWLNPTSFFYSASHPLTCYIKSVKHLILLLFLAFPLSVAQLCTTELESVLLNQDLQQVATGHDAAQLIQRTIEILEPALPRLAYLPDPFDYAEVSAAVYLGEHGLLPAIWEPETLAFEVWQEMVIGLAAWFDLRPRILPELSKVSLIQTLSMLIEDASSTMNPVALIASRENDRNQLAFLGVVRNDSVYPRLIVYKPLQENMALNDGVDEVLASLGNCAYQVTDYIYAPEETAKKLFLANNDGRMLVASTYPVRPEELTYVPQGEETEYLTFESVELEPYSMYAALFEGSGISPLLVTRLLTSVRTNMNPKEVLDFVMGN